MVIRIKPNKLPFERHIQLGLEPFDSLETSETHLNSIRKGIGHRNEFNSAIGFEGLRGSAEGQKVTEWLTRIGANKIAYRFTVDDPATYDQPFSGEVAFNATKGPMYEYACHEGNYAMEGILAGAREAERGGRAIEGARGEVREEGAN